MNKVVVRFSAARAAALAAATESPQMNLALLNGAECAVQAMVQTALATGFQPFEESGGARLGAEMIISSVSSLLQGADLLAVVHGLFGADSTQEVTRRARAFNDLLKSSV